MYGRPEIIQVNGENGARAYQMPPNSSQLLLDNNEPILWVKTTDGAGYPTITPYTISPYTPPEPIDLHDIVKRLEKLENESHTTTTKSTKRKSAEPISEDDE